MWGVFCSRSCPNSMYSPGCRRKDHSSTSELGCRVTTLRWRQEDGLQNISLTDTALCLISAPEGGVLPKSVFSPESKTWTKAQEMGFDFSCFSPGCTSGCNGWTGLLPVPLGTLQAAMGAAECWRATSSGTVRSETSRQHRDNSAGKWEVASASCSCSYSEAEGTNPTIKAGLSLQSSSPGPGMSKVWRQNPRQPKLHCVAAGCGVEELVLCSVTRA